MRSATQRSFWTIAAVGVAAILTNGLLEGCSSNNGPSDGSSPAGVECALEIDYDGIHYGTPDAVPNFPAKPERGERLGTTPSECPGDKENLAVYAVVGLPASKGIVVEHLGPLAPMPEDRDPDPDR